MRPSDGGIFLSQIGPIGPIWDRVFGAMVGERFGPPPQILWSLSHREIGKQQIRAMWVRREPIPRDAENLLEMLSLGSWGRAKRNEGYHIVHHVLLIILLQNGQLIAIDKAPVVRIRPLSDVPKGEFFELVPLPWPTHSGISLARFFSRVSALVGRRFWDWEAIDNNCQQFLLDLLWAWNLLTPQLYAFIKQPMDRVLSNPLTFLVAQSCADLATRTDILVHGT